MWSSSTYVNPGCLKRFSGMNLSLVNKKSFSFFSTYFHFLYSPNKMGILLKKVPIPNWLNSPLAFRFLSVLVFAHCKLLILPTTFHKFKIVKIDYAMKSIARKIFDIISFFKLLI